MQLAVAQDARRVDPPPRNAPKSGECRLNPGFSLPFRRSQGKQEVATMRRRNAARLLTIVILICSTVSSCGGGSRTSSDDAASSACAMCMFNNPGDANVCLNICPGMMPINKEAM
jgi:hypothetical protein